MQNAVNNLFLQKNAGNNNVGSAHSSDSGYVANGIINSPLPGPNANNIMNTGGSNNNNNNIGGGGGLLPPSVNTNINGSLSVQKPPLSKLGRESMSPGLDPMNTSGSTEGGRYVTYIEPTNIHAALENVATWVGTVMVNLKEIQWRQLGFAIKADGTPDANFPLYNIPNPITTINNISHQYATFVDPSLRLLSNKLNDNNSNNNMNGSNNMLNSMNNNNSNGGMNMNNMMDDNATSSGLSNKTNSTLNNKNSLVFPPNSSQQLGPPMTMMGSRNVSMTGQSEMNNGLSYNNNNNNNNNNNTGAISLASLSGKSNRMSQSNNNINNNSSSSSNMYNPNGTFTYNL